VTPRLNISNPRAIPLALSASDSPAAISESLGGLLLALKPQRISVLVGQRRIGGAYVCGGGYGW